MAQLQICQKDLRVSAYLLIVTLAETEAVNTRHSHLVVPLELVQITWHILMQCTSYKSWQISN